MKLIDLLVKELPRRGGWPEAANYAVQDYDGTVKFSKSINFLHIKAGEWCSNKDGDDWIYGDRPFEGNFHHHVIAQDRNSSIVTRAQYEAALAASKAVVGHNGWINWAGGECPVDDDTIVEVRFRWHDQHQYNNDRAGDFDWAHTGRSSDIIAYRLHDQGINHLANDDRLEQDLNECIGAIESQEWNGDGVPPIGCACEMQDSKGTWLPVEIIAKNDGFTFGWSYDYRIVFFGDKADEFRPLRTEGERAREASCRAISHILDEDRDFQFDAKKIYDAIAAGKIPGVKLEEK